MTKQHMKNEPEAVQSTWQSRLKKIPLTVRTGAVIALVGLSFASYSIGKSVQQAESKAPLTMSAANSSAAFENVNFRRNNNRWEFSSDGGKTWSKTPPEGISQDSSGRLGYEQAQTKEMNNTSKSSTYFSPFTDSDGNTVIMKREADVWTFSSDGGETWSEKIPEGIDIADDGTLTWKSSDGKQLSRFDPQQERWTYSEDGGKTWSDPLKEIEDWIENGVPLSDADGVSMKLENGKLLYSTDGGKTWSENAPEGYEAAMNTVLSKTEDGKTLYSTDGGKTWSEEKPEGFDVPSIDEIMEAIPEEWRPSSEEELGSNPTAI
ncbi:WD40/YVTN/BNR-like repeat-containing protein [Enterococcus sp. LJL128]